MEHPFEKLLVEEGLVSPEQMEQALSISREKRSPLVRVLADERFADEEAVLRLCARRQAFGSST